ncbi:MAG: polyprenyl synthetase family protein [Hymenobacteraceae bacterium]|nr:polyprenyl synthetase family protein [Hymenobacteraceae bacterium]MDX5395048.1 polyprenyl synthetase family protein [Hymenobacteraceae bacterium]MDX5511084.1 polyprenyl synthetase family protein [Hymenobacteraceae bacterium]
MNISNFSETIQRGLSTLNYGEKPAELYEPIRYIMSLGGKRIRPLLTLLAAHLYTDDVEKVLKPALATEVFHNFTLMHDDIMDQAPLRRGQPTVHEKWNQNTAILSGDVMLVRAYELFFDVEPDKLAQVLKMFSTCAAEVCEGQQLDISFENRDDVSIEEYLHMIRLKTAVLLGFALELGAVLAGATPSDASHIKQFGIDIGVAFQLRDDLLDVYADQEKFVKQVGGDILSDKKTFLLLTAIAQANPEQKQQLVKWRNDGQSNSSEKVKAVTEIYNQLHVKQQTEERINHYYKQAMQHLEQVQAPEQKKAVIKGLAMQLMERDS